MATETKIPREFFWRRMHSLTGFWLALFLFIHLLTNSQAALYIGEDGKGFIHEVNKIHNLPYLHVIEIILLAVPILIHMMWGIVYLRTGKLNSFGSDGTTPALGRYGRNQAYSWQRITSWILMILLIGHIVQMRFLNYPDQVKQNGEEYYVTEVQPDPGIKSVASRLKVKLEDGAEGELIATAPDFGTAALLIVRETFKSPLMIALYTLFVLSACYHGYNGLWTFMISWGINVTERAQTLMYRVSVSLMVLVSFLGLAAIWGTYWINLIE